MVRDTDNMTTTSQLVLDLTDKVVYLYLLPKKVKYLGYENKLPAGHKAKIRVKVLEYTDEEGTVKDHGLKAAASRVASRWLSAKSPANRS